jgi:hypothetical protein
MGGVTYLQESHVHPIDVRSLLSIYLDIDEVLIHDLGNLLVFKRLVG